LQPTERQKLKQFAGHSVIYGLGDALYKGIAFFLLPVYMRYLSPADYGVLETLLVTREICIALLSMGIPVAFLKYYYDNSESCQRLSFVSTSFWSYILFQLPIPVILIVFNSSLSNLIFKTEQYAVCFSILAVNITLIAFRKIPLTLYRARNMAIKYSVITFLVAVFTLLFNIYFVVVAKKGVEGILWGNFMGGLTGVILVLLDVKAHVSFRINTSLLKKMLRYGFPLSLSTILLSFVFINDRYFLAYFSTLDELGKYALGSKFSSLMMVFFITPFLLNWVPFISANQKEPNKERLYSTVGATFFYLGVNMVFFISVFAPLVITLIAPDAFGRAYTVIPMLAYAILLYGIGFVFRSGILISDNTNAITKIVVSGLAVNIGLNFTIIPLYGMHGAAISMLASFMLMACYSYYESQKKLAVEYPFIKMTVITCFSILFIVFYYIIFPTIERYLIKLVIALFFSVIFISVNHLTGIIDIKSIFSAIKNRSIVNMLKR
jgi:O-antigen/teichoic acid export membrane protein